MSVYITWELLRIAAWTAIIEIGVFWLVGYRRVGLLAAFAGINVISNILLNEFLASVDYALDYRILTALGEAVVVVLEYCLLQYTAEGREHGLLPLLLLSNAVSLGIGLLFKDVF